MASKTTNRLYKINGATSTVVGSYATGREPFGVAVNQNTRKVFVANYAGNSLSIFNGDTGALLSTINFAPLGYGQPAFVAVDETLNRAYVTLHAGGRLAVIDGASNALLTTVEAEAGVFGVAVHPGLRRAYVTSRETRNLVVFDTTTNTRIWEQTAASSGEPYALAVDAVRNRLYVVDCPPRWLSRSGRSLQPGVERRQPAGHGTRWKRRGGGRYRYRCQLGDGRVFVSQ